MISQLYGKVITPSAVVIVFERDGKSETCQVPSTDSRYDPLLTFLAMAREPFGVDALAKLEEHLAPVVIKDIEKIAPQLQPKFAEAHFAKADTKALKRFNDRLATNPTASARLSLFGYVEKHGVTVDADGCMIFYKRVRSDLGSFHDSDFKYRVGAWSEVPRNRCVDRPTEDCGFGLHVCPWKFLGNWFSGGVILEIVVPPENFTSVPPSNGKLLAYKVFTRRIVPEGETPTNPIVETAQSRAASDPKVRASRAARPTVEAEAEAEDEAPALSAELKRRRIPQSILQSAGIQAGTESKVRIMATDPRSRFLLVTTLSNEELRGDPGNRILKRDRPFHETASALSLDDYAVAVPLAMFSAAQIEGRSPYTARVLGPNVIEIRPT